MALPPGPLPAHPPPRPGESIGNWIARLASANKTSFKLMFFHINRISKSIGFLTALSEFTRVPIQQLQKLSNEFKPEFWKNLKQCPTKKCNYTAHKPHRIINHLCGAHNLGVKWQYCPICVYKTK
ncbi:MAG: TniQ family protein [Candidatus Helarchaeota archaeon]